MAPLDEEVRCQSSTQRPLMADVHHNQSRENDAMPPPSQVRPVTLRHQDLVSVPCLV